MTLFSFPIHFPDLLWPRKRKCLLLVEDSIGDRVFIEDAWTELGWDCDVANTAEMGEGFIHLKKYPLVLVDMRLPRKQGWEFLIESINLYPHSFYAALAGEPHDLADMPRGFSVYTITKPDEASKYVAMFKRLLKDARL